MLFGPEMQFHDDFCDKMFITKDTFVLPGEMNTKNKNLRFGVIGARIPANQTIPEAWEIWIYWLWHTRFGIAAFGSLTLGRPDFILDLINIFCTSLGAISLSCFILYVRAFVSLRLTHICSIVGFLLAPQRHFLKKISRLPSNPNQASETGHVPRRSPSHDTYRYKGRPLAVQAVFCTGRIPCQSVAY